MRIGVIGLGHIGYPIASRMHSSGHEVHSWTRSEKIVPWLNFTNLDAGVDIALDSLFIASGGARPNYASHEIETITTQNLVSKFKLSMNTKIFYISSGAVYGECSIAQSEIDDPRPSTEYGKAKLFTEKKLQEIYGHQISVLRVGNIIDEVNPYGIVAHLTTSIEKGVLQVFGEPADCRDYLGILDFLNCVERLIEIQHLPALLNVGSGKSISLEQIVHLSKEVFGNRLDVHWGERRIGDLSQTKLDVAQMHHILQNKQENPLKIIKSLMISLNSPDHLGN
jgi:nucleoside-diphosphate-sugar epimerase